MSDERTLLVLGRAWCHLCDDMYEALQPLVAEVGFTVRKVDIDACPDWLARWDEDIPVLLGSDHALICMHRLDPEAVRAYLRRFG